MNIHRVIFAIAKVAVAHVFRVFLFILFVYVLIKMWRRYMQPSLDEMREERDSAVSDLNYKATTLEEQNKNMRVELVAKRESLTSLEARVHEWKRRLKLSEQTEIDEQAKIAKALFEKRQLTAKRIADSEELQEVVRKVFDKASVRLSDKYNGDPGQRALRGILDGVIDGH